MKNKLISVKNFIITPVRCEHCHLPLEGWRYRLFVKPLFRIRRVADKRVCSNCLSEERR